MNRRVWIRIALVLALGLIVALGAAAQGKEKKTDLNGHKLGLIFNLDNFLLDIGDAAQEGVVAGLGLKYWLGDKAALRGVLGFNYTNDSASSTSATTFGLSVAFEYHFLKTKVSPYVGGLAEGQFMTPANHLRFSLGGIFGAEVAILDYLGLYAEYNLLIVMDEPVFSIDLGIGNHAQIGLIVYLP
jgi:hypothetical protein